MYKHYFVLSAESVTSAAMCTITAMNGFSCFFIFDDTPYCKRCRAGYNQQYNRCSHHISSFRLLIIYPIQ